MISKAVNLHKIEDIRSVPDGEYDGVWHGYSVRFTVNNNEYVSSALKGVRGTSSCKVTIKDGEILVETT